MQRGIRYRSSSHARQCYGSYSKISARASEDSKAAKSSKKQERVKSTRIVSVQNVKSSIGKRVANSKVS